MILIKFGQHVNEMMAVAVKNFQNLLWSCFYFAFALAAICKKALISNNVQAQIHGCF